MSRILLSDISGFLPGRFFDFNAQIMQQFTLTVLINFFASVIIHPIVWTVSSVRTSKQMSIMICKHDCVSNSVRNHCPLDTIFEVIVQICPSDQFQVESSTIFRFFFMFCFAS